MSNYEFDKNGLNKFGMHWLQYSAYVVTVFAIYFGWAFFHDSGFHHFTLKIFNFWNCNGYNPPNYCLMRLKLNFYP